MKNERIKTVAVSGGTINELPEVGQVIKPGETLYVLEIMKTMYPVPLSGKQPALIEELHVKTGDLVNKYDLILDYTTEEEI